jgi:hypothetical protein
MRKGKQLFLAMECQSTNGERMVELKILNGGSNW